MDCRNTLERLKKLCSIGADTADLEAIKKFGLDHVTTNPSILKGCRGAYNEVILKRGAEILNCIPGTLSIQIDPRFAYDKEKTIQQGREWWNYFKERIMIKIPATLEGIEAMEILEAAKIPCNMTLLFSMEQARKCKKATCVAPYVGRVSDWHQDPIRGVLFAKELKKCLNSKIMGASFRSIEQILSLHQLDYLTIAPKYLESLSQDNRVISSSDWGSKAPDPSVIELLDQGIASFIQDVNVIEGEFP